MPKTKRKKISDLFIPHGTRENTLAIHALEAAALAIGDLCIAWKQNKRFEYYVHSGMLTAAAETMRKGLKRERGRTRG
jgi:hypothetical protein